MNEFDFYPFDAASPTLRTLQAAMSATDELVADLHSALAAGEEKLTNFLPKRVFSKNTSLCASVPLSKHITFDQIPDQMKPRHDLEARAAEIERTALKVVINVVEVSQLVNLSELLEHRAVEESLALFNSSRT